jgi:hypothetical protein
MVKHAMPFSKQTVWKYFCHIKGRILLTISSTPNTYSNTPIVRYLRFLINVLIRDNKIVKGKSLIMYQCTLAF